MAYENALHSISLVSASDYSAKQYYAGVVDSNGKIALAGASAFAIGIVQNNPTADQIATVGIGGVTKAVYGASVTAGNKLCTDANGKLIPVATTEPVVAIALQSGSASEIHSVLITSF